MEPYVKLSTEKYEELVKKCARHDMLLEAYKNIPSYRFDDVLKIFFGTPEEGATDKENG